MRALETHPATPSTEILRSIFGQVNRLSKMERNRSIGMVIGLVWTLVNLPKSILQGQVLDVAIDRNDECLMTNDERVTKSEFPNVLNPPKRR